MDPVDSLPIYHPSYHELIDHKNNLPTTKCKILTDKMKSDIIRSGGAIGQNLGEMANQSSELLFAIDTDGTVKSLNEVVSSSDNAGQIHSYSDFKVTSRNEIEFVIFLRLFVSDLFLPISADSYFLDPLTVLSRSTRTKLAFGICHFWLKVQIRLAR